VTTVHLNNDFAVGSLAGKEHHFVDTEKDDASVMWLKLEQRHRKAMLSSIQNALTELKSLKFNGFNFTKHVDNFNSLKDEYEKLGGKKVRNRILLNFW
jgi:hypothetical protein